MSPKIDRVAPPPSDTPILAWFFVVALPPVKPIGWPFQVPVMAIATGPVVPSVASQHWGLAAVVVGGISGSIHQVAAFSAGPALADGGCNSADTICHGGTSRLDGLEISRVPLDSVAMVAVALFDNTPRCQVKCGEYKFLAHLKRLLGLINRALLQVAPYLCSLLINTMANDSKCQIAQRLWRSSL